MSKKYSIPTRWTDILLLLLRRGWADIFDVCPLYISNVQYARVVINKLICKGLIVKVMVPLFPQTRGNGTAFYTISKAGYAYIKGSARGFRVKSIPTSIHFMHYWIKNRFCTAFTLRHKALVFTDSEIQQFNNLSKEHYSSGATDEYIIPDFIAITSGTLFIGEVDCATETLVSKRSTLKTIEGKFYSLKTLLHADYIREWEQITQESIINVRYLHITTGTKNRVSAIAELAATAAETVPVLITTVDNIAPVITYDEYRYPLISYDSLFNGVWFSLPSGSSTTLEKELSHDA